MPDGFAFTEVDDPLVNSVFLRLDFEAEEVGEEAAVDLGDVFVAGLPDEVLRSEFGRGELLYFG